MEYWPPPMIYQTHYLWYFEPLPMIFLLLPIECQTLFCRKLWVKCNCYGIFTPSHGILNPIPMEYQTPSFLKLLVKYRCWGILTPSYGILTPPSTISCLEMRGFKIPQGITLPYRGGHFFNKGVQYTMDENWLKGQYTMSFKIPYDTGTL